MNVCWWCDVSIDLNVILCGIIYEENDNILNWKLDKMYK